MKKIFTYITLITLSICFATCSKKEGLSTSGTGGSTARMTIAGNYLYIVSASKLYTYDITDAANTVLLNDQNISWGDIETIFPYRDKLFIGAQGSMHVFDISNPKKPQPQGRAQHLRSCDPVVADASYAYVTLRNTNANCGGSINQLQIYDIQGTNVTAPKIVSTLDMPEPNGLGYKNNILYICMGKQGLNLVNISDKAKPTSVKIITGETFIDVIPYDDILIAYVEGGIVLYNIADAANPQKLSSIKN